MRVCKNIYNIITMKWFNSNLHFILLCSLTSTHITRYKSTDIYRYKSKYRRIYKNNHKYTNLVEDHHCIPCEYKDHELLKNLEFDINSSNNLIIMPNKYGKYILNLHPDTLVHQGGHVHYNRFVKSILDEILLENTDDDKKYILWLFIHYLKNNLQINKDNIPWN